MEKNRIWVEKPDAEAMALRLYSNSFEDVFFLTKPVGHDAEICIYIRKVLWIEAENNYSCLHLIDQPCIRVPINIGQIEEFLSTLPTCDFIRINRSEIINLRWLHKIEVNLVYLVGRDITFTVGKTYRKSFNEQTAAFRLVGK